MRKPRQTIAADMAQRTQKTELFRIVGKESVSETETLLRIQSTGERNQDPLSEQEARMIKVGADWKFDGWAGN